MIKVRKELQETKYAQIGVNAINRKLYLQGTSPLPESTIKCILKREGLQRKKVSYVPKGKAYPKPIALCANNIHQADLVGPRYIKQDGRFYSLNVMDIATHRITLHPSRCKDDRSIAQGLIKTWNKLGIPDYLQIDNELSFRGNNHYPHSLGLVLILCLSLGVQPMFIPQGEPWRNGEIESFQDTFDKAFFRSQYFPSFRQVCLEASGFEDYHNEHYVYSCLNGKTLDQALVENSIGIDLSPASFQLQKSGIPIEDGSVHFFRFIRSDKKLNIFGEKFTVSEDLVYKYTRQRSVQMHIYSR